MGPTVLFFRFRLERSRKRGFLRRGSPSLPVAFNGRQARARLVNEQACDKNMNVKIQNRHVRVTRDLNSLIERQATKIRKLLPTFRSHDLDVHVNLEQLSTKRQFHVALVLTLPQKAIHVDTIEVEVSTAVLRAFNELRRRVKRFKSHLNRERIRRRAPLPTAEPPPSEPVSQSGETLGESLEKIENYIRREIYHRAILQGLPPGILQPHALVDDVFVEVNSRQPARPEHLSQEQWMFQVARRILNKRLQEVRESGKDAHIEEPSTDSGKWDDEPLNFYQPDELLRLEDLVRDSKAATPEEYLAEEETEERLQSAIADLPDETREPFILYALEGFNSDEVAMILGKKKEQVLEDVKRARQLLLKQVEGEPPA